MEDWRKNNETEFNGEIIGDQEIGRWQNKAREYVKDPVKTESLLGKAIKKAEDNKYLDVINNLWEKIQLLISLVKDWLSGEYRKISKSSLIMIIAGLLYFVSPIDFVPDWITALGLLDDAAVLGLIINQLDKELVGYKEWKKSKYIILEDHKLK